MLTSKYSSLLLVPAELRYWYSLPAFSQLFLAMPNSSRKTGLPISAAHWDELAMKPLAKVFAASRFASLEFNCSRRFRLVTVLIVRTNGSLAEAAVR